MAIEIKGKVKVSLKFRPKSHGKKLAVITIGIPGSGKTTWAEQQKGYVNLNLDDFREKISGDATNQNVSKQAIEMRDAFLRRASKKQQNVIISDTNINPFFREKLELQLKQAGYVIQYKIFDIALDEAKVRNSKRERKVPEDIIEKMHNSLQEQLSTNEELKKFVIAKQDLYRPISQQSNEVTSPINTSVIEPHMSAAKSVGTLDELVTLSKYPLDYNSPIEAISRIIYYAYENSLSITEPSVVAYIRKYKDIITVEDINKEHTKLGTTENHTRRTDIPLYLKSILGD